MRGLVLAAGGGTRLRPLTDDLPKTLLPVDGERTILEVVVANLAAVGVREVVVVAGHAAARIDAVVGDLAARLGVDVEVVRNPRYATANNAFSLLFAAEHLREGALVVNGDTVHPVSVERRLLDARGAAPLLLAVDDVKPLADEEMKVQLAPDGAVLRISKQLDPAAASGEYIGVCLVEPEAVDPLVDALAWTVEADPSRWYEDGFQRHVDLGGRIAAVPIGAVDWVEVDDHADLARARSLPCPS